MRVESVTIEGFRSIDRLTLDLAPLQTLLGPNNCGKSNLLAALEFFFGGGERLGIDDFHKPKSSPRREELRITLTFSALTEADKVEFGKYVLRDGRVKVVRLARLEGKAPQPPEYHGVLLFPTDSRYDPASYSGTPTERLAAVCAAFPRGREYRGAERLTNELVREILERLADDNRAALGWEERLAEEQFFGARQVAAPKLGRFLHLPAIPDAGLESNARGGSHMGLLLEGVLKDIAATSPEYGASSAALRGAISRFNRVLADGSRNTARPPQLDELERRLASEMRAWAVDVRLDIPVPDIDEFISRPQMQVDDGYESSIEAKGHGLQRAFLLAVLRVWRDHLLPPQPDGVPKGPESPVLLAIEEPEIYQHPQRQRELFQLLKDLSESSGHQVLIVTHSPVFIDMSNPRTIVRFWKGSENETCCKRLATDPFEGAANERRKRRFQLAHWIDPTRGELFFAKRVVLVEGPTELAVIPFVASTLAVLDPQVSVIECGGKGAIPIYIELLKAFDIDYKVVHDEDPIKAAPGEPHYSDQKRIFDLNAEISAAVARPDQVRQIRPEFEALAGIPKSQAEKVGKPLAGLEHVQAQGATAELTELVKWIFGP